jgi:hypothetical protein
MSNLTYIEIILTPDFHFSGYDESNDISGKRGIMLHYFQKGDNEKRQCPFLLEDHELCIQNVFFTDSNVVSLQIKTEHAPKTKFISITYDGNMCTTNYKLDSPSLNGPPVKSCHIQTK